MISKSGQSLDNTKIVISEEILEKLTKKGLFSVPFEFNPEEQAKVEIRLCLSEEPQNWFMISGFPKRLNNSVVSGMSFHLESCEVSPFLIFICPNIGARFRKSASRSILEQSSGIGQRYSDWNLSSPEVHSGFPVPGFKRWDSMPVDEKPMDEKPINELFSAETWSNHLENQPRDMVFELGDNSVQDSDVESI